MGRCGRSVCPRPSLARRVRRLRGWACRRRRRAGDESSSRPADLGSALQTRLSQDTGLQSSGQEPRWDTAGAERGGARRSPRATAAGGSRPSPTTSALSPAAPQDFLQGDCTKAKQKLNWKPRVAFDVSDASERSSGPGRRVRERGGSAWTEGANSALSHPCAGSQELVREMVDADVELMRNNPNA